MKYPEFEKLASVIEAMLDPKSGCPWDLKQNHQSLLKYLIEESYEFVHAVGTHDDRLMEEELGDVLLQVMLHSRIAEKEKRFSIESVSKVLTEKLVRRHPHVFAANDERPSAEEVEQNWQKTKEKEKKEAPLISPELARFPALLGAYKIGKATEKLDFDWDHVDQVKEKVEEEWDEVKEELAQSSPKEKIEEELGDFLFTVAQYARHLGVDPEVCLARANQKFLDRFSKMEVLAGKDGFRKMERDQKELLWQKVKGEES